MRPSGPRATRRQHGPSSWREVETKHLKSGVKRQKVCYADVDQCLSYLENRVEEAKTEAEVSELLADALIAGLLADQAELPRSKRVRWGTHADDAVTKLLAADIKAVKPRAPRKAKAP